ncbi:MAG: rhamnogalacturonan acetylesterase [Lachnospiraceae bacterium]|nr:rhamnogalacturonan acetylesterase [Lachnospiraceae bacterium]
MNVIYWAGDSTVQFNNIYTYPQTGIGQEMCRYLKKDIRVENHAKNGRSTKSFLDEGRFDTISRSLSEGDFLFIQFGHNDEKAEDPSRYTEPLGAYYDNLKFMADAALSAGAHPVLITPLERRKFREGKLDTQAHAPYVQAMKKLAEDTGTALIDLNAMSRRALEEAGEEKSLEWYMHVPAGVYDAFPDGKEDDTHLKHEGAVFYAGLIADALKELGGIYALLLAEPDQNTEIL